MRDIEKKRAYDRQRMARLHAEGKTWWQLHDDLRPYYDQARTFGNYMVQLAERIGSNTDRLAFTFQKIESRPLQAPASQGPPDPSQRSGSSS